MTQLERKFIKDLAVSDEKLTSGVANQGGSDNVVVEEILWPSYISSDQVQGQGGVASTDYGAVGGSVLDIGIADFFAETPVYDLTNAFIEKFNRGLTVELFDGNGDLWSFTPTADWLVPAHNVGMSSIYIVTPQWCAEGQLTVLTVKKNGVPAPISDFVYLSALSAYANNDAVFANALGMSSSASDHIIKADLNGLLDPSFLPAEVAFEHEVAASVAAEAQIRAEQDSIITGQLSTLQSSMTTAEGDIDALEGRATSLEGRMSTAEADINTVEGRMSTAEADIDNVEGRATALEGRMSTAEADINTVETSISNHLNDAVDAHDASAISAVAQTNYAIGDDVQEQLQQLDARSAIRLVHQLITLTQTNVDNKSFNLSALCPSHIGWKMATILFPLGGVPQVYSVDFTLSGYTVSWAGLGMESLALEAGDKIAVYYHAPVNTSIA